MIDGPLDIDETETQHFLGPDSQEKRKPNPLPKLQFAIVLLLRVCEPITSQSIYPYINQVHLLRRSREPLLIVFNSLFLSSILLVVTTVRSGTMLDSSLSGCLR
jgi:hypothetical protein